jgi:integrase
MKAGKEHRVPLSDRAIAILKALPREGDYVFLGARKDKPLSNMAMLELARHARRRNSARHEELVPRLVGRDDRLPS